MKKIGVIDIETTGFLKQGGTIVEIAIAALDLDTGDITIEYDSLVREQDFGPRHAQRPFGWIFDNSNLKYNDVVSAPLLHTQHNEIQRVLNSFELGQTAYNSSFDFGFLVDRGFVVTPLPCAMLTATPVVNLPPVAGRRTPKWPNVQEAWDFFFGKTDYIEEHRAADDAYHEAQIVYELYKLGAFRVDEEYSDAKFQY